MWNEICGAPMYVGSSGRWATRYRIASNSRLFPFLTSFALPVAFKLPQKQLA